MAGPLHSNRSPTTIGASAGTDVLTPAVLVREGLYRLTNRLVIASLCRRYTDQIFNYDVTSGICYIKKPFYATVPESNLRGNRELQDQHFQEVSDETIAVEIDQRERIGFAFYDTDRTLSIVDWTSRYVSSGIEELAEKVEEAAVKELVENPQYINHESLNTAFSAKAALRARAYMEDMSIPSMNNYCVINPGDYVAIADDFRSINTSMPDGSMMSSIVTSHYKGMLADYKVYTSNKIPRFFGGSSLLAGVQIAGTLGTSGWEDIDGNTHANLTGNEVFNTLVCDQSTSAQTLVAGQYITVPGVYERQVRGSREATPRLFKFKTRGDVTTTDTLADLITIPVEPYSMNNRNYPNVSAWPADNAEIAVQYVNQTLSQQVFWHRDAMNMVSPSLVTPDGAVESGKATDEQTGISMQYVKDYDITTGKSRLRIDTIFGFKMLRPEMAILNFANTTV